MKIFKCELSDRIIEEIRNLQERMAANEQAWLEKKISLEKFDSENQSITGKAKFTLSEILRDCKMED